MCASCALMSPRMTAGKCGIGREATTIDKSSQKGDGGRDVGLTQRIWGVQSKGVKLGEGSSDGHDDVPLIRSKDRDVLSPEEELALVGSRKVQSSAEPDFNVTALAVAMRPGEHTKALL